MEIGIGRDVVIAILMAIVFYIPFMYDKRLQAIEEGVKKVILETQKSTDVRTQIIKNECEGRVARLQNEYEGVVHRLMSEYDSRKQRLENGYENLILQMEKVYKTKVKRSDGKVDAFSTIGNDTCPEDWSIFGSSCYAVIRKPVEWPSAARLCLNLHANLAEINSEAENNFIRQYLKDRELTDGVWIGGSDAVVEGRWIWLGSQTTFTVTDWVAGEPNNDNGNEDCVHINPGHDFHWNDALCTIAYDFLCEKSIDKNHTIDDRRTF